MYPGHSPSLPLPPLLTSGATSLHPQGRLRASFSQEQAGSSSEPSMVLPAPLSSGKELRHQGPQKEEESVPASLSGALLCFPSLALGTVCMWREYQHLSPGWS